MSRRRPRLLVLAAAAAALALTQLAAAGNGAAADPALKFTPAAVYSSPEGASPTHWYNRPNLAVARVPEKQPDGTTKTVARLFRTVNRAAADSADVNDDYFENQWSDVGSGSWHTMTYDKFTNRPQNQNFVQDGNTLYSFDTIAYNYDTQSTGIPTNPTFAAIRRTSTDGGQTWTTDYSTVTMPIPGVDWRPSSNRIFLYQGITKLGDQWLMPVYSGEFWDPGTGPACSATVSSPCRLQAGLLVSTDHGKNWKRVAAPFKSSINEYTETTAAITPSQHVLMVSRFSAPNTGNYLGELFFRETVDPVDGSTDLSKAQWATKTVLVPGAPTRDGRSLGASPVLEPVAGRLLLAFGRPDNMLALSTDADGTAYTPYSRIHPNQPTVTTCHDGDSHPSGLKVDANGKQEPAYNPTFCQALGSSGYMGVAVVTDNSTDHWGYVIGDRCHVWSCEPAPDAPNSYMGTEWKDVQWGTGGTQQAVWFDRFDVTG